MKNNRQEKINIIKMLSLFFQEEASSVTPPESQKLWEELKQRLGDKEIRPLPRPGRGSGFSLLLKNKPLAALAAASLVLAIVFSQASPTPSLRHFVDRFSSLSSADLQAEPAEDGFLKKRAAGNLRPEQKNEEQGNAETMEGDARTGEVEIKSIGPDQPDQKSFGYENQNLLRGRVQEQEIIWNEEPAFAAALNEIKDLAPEKIWKLNERPEGFDFVEGSFLKTENSLLQVSHNFINQEGQRLTLIQDFFLEEEESEVLLVREGPADPKKIGPFNGYFFRQQDGCYALIWKQNHSVVTLEGQLEEKTLLSLPRSLQTY
jgi:hypothetical protein